MVKVLRLKNQVKKRMCSVDRQHEWQKIYSKQNRPVHLYKVRCKNCNKEFFVKKCKLKKFIL